MPWAAAAAVAGAAISANASSKASKAQTNAANAASQAQLAASEQTNALQKSIYEQNRRDSSPWVNTGEGALNQLAWKMGITPTNSVQGSKTREDYYNELLKSGSYTSTVTVPGKKKKKSFLSKIDPLGGAVLGALGGAPAGGSYQVVDYNALNAAADRAFAEQPVRTPYQGDPAEFGWLQKRFGMEDFQTDPGYQFRMDEGNKGVEQSAAARGMQLSGATMKALQRFGQDTASAEYGNAYNRFNNDQTTQFNRLSGIAGTGQTQVNQLGLAGQNYASNVGNNLMNTATQVGNNTMGAANARASSYMATANGINNAVGTGINAYQQQQYLNKMGSNNMQQPAAPVVNRNSLYQG